LADVDDIDYEVINIGDIDFDQPPPEARKGLKKMLCAMTRSKVYASGLQKEMLLIITTCLKKI